MQRTTLRKPPYLEIPVCQWAELDGGTDTSRVELADDTQSEAADTSRKETDEIGRRVELSASGSKGVWTLIEGMAVNAELPGTISSV